MNRFAIGTDVGGSHICSAVVDLQSKSILKETFALQEVNNQASAEEILKNWAAALNKSIAAAPHAPLAGIGFAMPGPFDYANGIALFTNDVAKYQSLHGINISEYVRDLLNLSNASKDFDFRYVNDATSFGIGEAWRGKAVGVKRSLLLTLGTGFGAVFIENGVPVVDGDEVPMMGSMWHLPFNGGIADDSFSARWFMSRHAEKAETRLGSVKEIAAKASENEPIARELFAEFGANLGNFLAPWLKKFAAEVLVIGGNVSSAYNHFGPLLERSIRSQNLPTVVQISELKEDAALIGSARLFEDNFWPRIKPLLPKMCPRKQNKP